ncbi:phosphoribosyl pyrophosphokinase [Pseudovirgaria hyperparasitica]|uniref:Phosphoribosyl pyrophosphokinase n=1 Tax=Pseudovirgaria hyperparasitica TaxID=470096 RepID=A0A6A6VUH5_9PEZI|nr:phosphoribosyl pyrophosphokinase [Pseudovirgaria hyperparasitica]KAF2753384.1 phosphoribosyl pyrophosphokinase [Pseudovirgaria hyperparasitica]
MVRNIVILGGSSHPQLTEGICNHLGIPPAKVLLSKFAVGETRVEIIESVRGKDVFILQSGGGKVNDDFMELVIMISACKIASARRVTAVLPLFPYSRQSDVPYNKVGAPLAKGQNGSSSKNHYTFDSRPQTPYPGQQESQGLNTGTDAINSRLSELRIADRKSDAATQRSPTKTNGYGPPKRSDTAESSGSNLDYFRSRDHNVNGTHEADKDNRKEGNKGQLRNANLPAFQPQRGYRQWVAQAGTLVADLLTCAGADHVITMDLHDPQYQGFFDIPVDNLYGRHMLRKYIQYNIPKYQDAVVVSPDAGGAKRATAIADALGMPFALIHKERRPTQINDRQNATMMLVGDVAERTAILIDDLADTSNTITRAAKLLKNEGATKVIALVTHGILSGDAIDRINASALDKVVVTNSVDQTEHKTKCPKLEVLDIGHVFAEAIRRVHHGESISVLFNYD